ncbi:MAG: hypothetical protein H5T69_12645 [Chloroflexi bacterium]|nr:hypothetical protein [Chloroflexota bacterium]
MRRMTELWKGERGDILPFALVAMIVGALLVGPLLSHLSGSYRTIEAGRARMQRQYASDAGAEYAIYHLQNIVDGVDLRSTLVAQPNTPILLALPSPVNGEPPVVEVVYVGAETEVTQTGLGYEPLQWVLWADSTSANHTIQTTGQGHTIYGGVHSNHNIFISGSGHVISGTVRYVNAYNGSGVTIIPAGAPVQSEVQPMPMTWDLADFAPGPEWPTNPQDPNDSKWTGWGKYAKAAHAAGLYHYHEGDWNYGGSGLEVPMGLHYVTGDAKLEGAGLVGQQVTVVSEETIALNGSNVDMSAYITDTVPLVFFANYSGDNKGINISGSGHIEGVSYAPNGLVTLTGSGGAIRGAFLGGTIKVAGEGATIELADVEVPSDSLPTSTVIAELFDVRSTVGDAVTTVRLRRDNDGNWQILSWSME